MSLESKSTPQDRSSLPNTQIKSELAERIERFQEAAQDLLDMHEPAGPGNETVATFLLIPMAKPAAITSRRERCSMSRSF